MWLILILLGAGGAARRRKELKFSWDDRVKHEDWGIQKVNMIILSNYFKSWYDYEYD